MKKYGFFPFAVFLGAFLLFQIQPLIGKYFLPWFGGAPSVWMICLMFFQLLLLGGYAYAYYLQRFVPKLQVMIHCTLLALTVLGGVGLFAIWGNPVLPSANWRPEQNGWPAWEVFRLLLISIGIPYFLLSTSASLLQAWFHRAEPSKSPYLFYIISNAASLLALLSYPLLFEPLLTLKTQAIMWSGGFVLYAILCALVARRVWPTEPLERDDPIASGKEKPGRRDYLVWIALSACGVLVLMAVTNQMTQNIPPVPFLWVLPLALYLLSYIVGFIERFSAGKWHDLYLFLVVFACYQAWYLIHAGWGEILIPEQIAGYSFILFFICLFCHSGLFRRKPEPRYLTNFYLSISFGGVLGGIFVAVIAPFIFNHYWEYQLCLILAAVLAVASVYTTRTSALYGWRHALWLPVLALAFYVSNDGLKETKRSVFMERNFFGKVHVSMKPQFNNTVMSYELQHGPITHGLQLDHPEYRKQATTYYTEQSGVGLAILNHPKRRAHKPMHVGLVGMGIGTLAAYGQQGDVYRFYEINPVVVNLATNSPWFSYIKDSKADIEIVTGDGRMALENEMKTGSQQFDLLVIDVFSGDQVPVHILTKEAFDLYLGHLEEDGVIAVHISSFYLNLAPVLKAIQEHNGLYGTVITSSKKDFGFPAQWVLMTRKDNLLRRINAPDFACQPVRLWTDDFSNLFSVLK